jgi:hypothetical protein
MALSEEVRKRISAFKLNEGLCNVAVQNTVRNWEIWRDCYERKAGFRELPLLYDHRLFLGFIYDYSLNRNVRRSDLESIRQRMLGMEDPMSVRELSEKISGPGRNLYSLSSKVLTLWRPGQFYPIDSMNRKGLRTLFSKNDQKGYGFSAVNHDSYGRLCSVLDSIVLRDNIFEEVDRKLEGAISDRMIARRRFVDNYFMECGRLTDQQA